ncbi:DUF1553 domain-containing protein [Pseudobythopirellula maris]|uniref:DUF1553 domain-containing protein n=1 Tax=Pseudobythopirellula maris TaxID=2527991 RepID=UPI0018D3FEF9|nr:DUF1553 domain-containing protein [Pseudobythopirellula maris]
MIRLYRRFAVVSLPVFLAALLAAGAALAEGPAAADHAAADPVTQPGDLAARARALLSDRCFTCHGPDSASREADLRLDLEGFYSQPSMMDEDRPIVTPGDPVASELVVRVLSDDEYEVMPPADSNLSLTADEKQLLRDWVAAGAPWAEHWAFVTPKASEAAGKETTIDHHVDAQLREEGLEPAPPADAVRLVRRVTMDLTGLPPTIAEVDAFAADTSPGAYERLVDRLLASPRFGERMALDWLDAARYADTYGYQNDRFSRVWPWRDWVVRAINANLPYDEFLTQQLAGDLLPEPTRDQLLATTFNRLHRQTNEGGSSTDEFRTENAADRANTFGSAMLGLTVECARCHDHKYDPISHKDYFRFFAYFNNLDELGLYSHYTDAVPTPTMWLDTPEQRAELEDLEAKIAAAERRLAEAKAEGDRDYLAFKFGSPTPVDDPLASAVAHYGFEESDPFQESDESEGDRGKLDGQPQTTEGVVGRALLLDGEDGFVTDSTHAFNRSQPFTLALWVRPTEEGQTAVVVHRSIAWLDAAGRGYQLTLDEGRPAAALVHFWPGDAMAVRASQSLPLGEWSHVAMTYDGSSRAAGLRLYVNGEPAETETLADKLTRSIRYLPGDLMKDKDIKLLVGHRFRDSGFRGGAVDELAVFDRELTAVELSRLTRPAGEWLGVDEAEQRRYFDRNLSEPYRQAAAELQTLRRQRDELVDSIEQIMVMREMPEPRQSYLLERGVYDAPADPVEPSTPAAIGPELSDPRPDRLGLARWVTDPRNPLTARVAVNRFWQTVFGRGLVDTPNDFGSQGSPPTHPQLLDDLAHGFVASGWDVKALVKKMVLSEAYRRSSVATAEQREADPENRLLARGPSYRYSAEAIRDTALAASGQLVERLGGPPVRPFQPPGLWKEKGAAKYERQPGEGSHRRSLYTVWKRTSPPPAMMTLDASEREVCVMRRQTTATPLQSLVMLNDPQFVEAACALADLALRDESRDTAEQIEWVFRRVVSRRPTTAEAGILVALYDEQLGAFDRDPATAERLLTVGDFAAASGAEPPRLAAMAMVAQAVMNHHAAVTKQ